MDTTPTSIAAILSQARARAGMTRGDLAIRAGVLASQIWDWETGRRQPRAETLEKLLQILNEAQQGETHEQSTAPG